MENNFILQQYLTDRTICDKLIEYHKNSEEKGPGLSGNGEINPDTKDSTDTDLKNDSPLYMEYLTLLKDVVDSYVNLYPDSAQNAYFGLTEGMSIQHYLPNQGYHALHCEKQHSNIQHLTRHLVFMTYLNDVPDGGTEFPLQGVKTTAKKGKTVIWPAQWTHMHRGEISTTQDKYIITGWFSYDLGLISQIAKQHHLNLHSNTN